jgi:hypothetical protein|tara:strand:- start:6029 stop:6193 length:165 start_codon:yes stop_codon:yes gene_type:complete
VKIGDLLIVSIKVKHWEYGILMGFNKKGEGGKDFVHVLVNGKIGIYLGHEVEKL